MLIPFKNRKLESFIFAVNGIAAAVVIATFVMLFGFRETLLNRQLLYTIQILLVFYFILEKVIRAINAESKIAFMRVFWFQIPLLLLVGVVYFGAEGIFSVQNPGLVKKGAVGFFLIMQVVFKVGRTIVNTAATGKNPTRTLIGSFVGLILAGTGMLMLPTASTQDNLSFVDALFTSTSATCVTGLVVKDTGTDFSLMGQCVILGLIQLGGLGIVIFGAVFALLLGQALSIKESMAMQDLLSAQTANRIGRIISFIFGGTLLIEFIGTVLLLNMWDNVPSWQGTSNDLWFYSMFHSISAFCNAGFSLFSTSFIGYNKNWEIFAVICPLIILGGLGFGVLFDLAYLASDRTKRFVYLKFKPERRLEMEVPKRMALQTKVVLLVSTLLIVLGMLAIYILDRYSCWSCSEPMGFANAFFQSVTARTAGFNTVDISKVAPAGKFFIMVLMFIGGSPGSPAGGIKTVTLAVVVVTAIAAIRKRQEVELFKRSIRLVIVGKAITVTLVFFIVLISAILALSITERNNQEFGFGDLAFEAGSALGTVGLSTGITPTLSTAGKLIITLVMLIGRLGPLTLLAELTFNVKPAKFNYPDETIIVG